MFFFENPAHAAQQRRLAQLSDDNAFVDAHAILRQHKNTSAEGTGGGGAEADELDAHFLLDGALHGGAASSGRGGSGSNRVNMNASSANQHRLYEEAVEEAWRVESDSDGDEDDGGKTRVRRRGGRKENAASREARPNIKASGAPQYLRRGEKRVWRSSDVSAVAEECDEEARILRCWHALMAAPAPMGGNKTLSSTVAAESLPLTVPPAVMELLSTCPSRTSMAAVTTVSQSHHLCSVCLLPAAYRCVRCRTALFCSISCHVAHDATRCLKFTI